MIYIFYFQGDKRLACMRRLYCTDRQKRRKNCNDCEDGTFVLIRVWGNCFCVPTSNGGPGNTWRNYHWNIDCVYISRSLCEWRAGVCFYWHLPVVLALFVTIPLIHQSATTIEMETISHDYKLNHLYAIKILLRIIII